MSAPTKLAHPMVVQSHRPNPRRLHRADCWHCWPSLGTKLVPATRQEARTLPTCYHCARAEQAGR
jgi:hypothetical protein